MTRLRAADLEGVLSVLEHAQSVQGEAAFTPELLQHFAQLVGCEEVAFFEVDHPRRVLYERTPNSGTASAWNGSVPDEVWTCARTVELNRWKLANGPGPVVLADVFNRRLRTSSAFNPNLGAAGAIDEIHVDLDPPRRWRAELAVYRSRDFGPRERLILRLIRPHLAAVYRAAKIRRRLAAVSGSLDPHAAAPLTPREREIIELVAEGKTNAEIATLLWIAPGTVRKHLEHVYERLDVGSRTAALAKLRV